MVEAGLAEEDWEGVIISAAVSAAATAVSVGVSAAGRGSAKEGSKTNNLYGIKDEPLEGGRLDVEDVPPELQRTTLLTRDEKIKRFEQARTALITSIREERGKWITMGATDEQLNGVLNAAETVAPDYFTEAEWSQIYTGRKELQNAIATSFGGVTPLNISDDRVWINIDNRVFEFANSQDVCAGILLHEYSHIAGQHHGANGWSWVPGAAFSNDTSAGRARNQYDVINYYMPK